MLPNNSWTILWLSSYILVSIFYILLLFDDRKVICSQRNQSTSKESITRVHISFFCHYIHIAKVKWFDFNFKTKRIYPMKLISNYFNEGSNSTHTLCIHTDDKATISSGNQERAILVRYFIKEIQRVNYHRWNRRFKFRLWFIITCIYVLLDGK